MPSTDSTGEPAQRSSSTDTEAELLNPNDRGVLVRIAHDSIAHGLNDGGPVPVDTMDLSPTLRAPGAAFVTLELSGALRGCIGSLEPHRGLAVDVSENAFAAAFRDPRFAPVTAAELARLHLSVSVLGPNEPIQCRTEQELLAALRPGVDGVILSAGTRRGTFLPSVWEQLPRPEDFLRHLKRKAGLPEHDWPADLVALRYRTQYFSN